MSFVLVVLVAVAAGWLAGETARARVQRRRPLLPAADLPPAAAVVARSSGALLHPRQIRAEVDRGMLALVLHLRERSR